MIRAVSRVACAQSIFFRREWSRRFPGFSLRHVVLYSLFFMLVFLLIRISLKTARLAKTLGSLCRDRLGVHYHPTLGALGAVCRASRVHVPFVMRYQVHFFSKKKKEAAGPLLGSNAGVFFFIRAYLVANGMVCRNSGFPVQGQVWGTLSSKFGRAACRVPCHARMYRVPRVHVRV